ncbi:MAG TPA: cyclic nucleotide-binding domain-containing protein [Actinomycetota bacterium]|nr:cyclic nucleotide-binding domain-containing protein [Actinomycetota bacterium]
MRIESSVTSVSWIPSEAIAGMTKLPFEIGLTHYDDPLPDEIEDLDELRRADRFRFANELRAWIEVEDGRVVDAGYSGSGHIGVSKVRLGSREAVFQAIPLPDIQKEPEITGTSVRFVQTAGGRTGMPAPRRVNRKPFVQVAAPLAWTTLGLTITADGSSRHDLLGASPFPRHWIYDRSQKLVEKTGLIDFKTWYREAFGEHTPWGDQDSPALVTEVETALERELSHKIMRGDSEPDIRRFKSGATVVEQGQPGAELLLLLDGVVVVEVNGESLAEMGPGAVVGERALLEGGTRTATLRAVTPCKIAAISGDQIDRDVLGELAEGRDREDRR